MAARNWHRDRFIPKDGYVHIVCGVCGKEFWLPPSKVANNRHCSRECGAAHRKSEKLSRSKKCETCGQEFTPRHAQLRMGHGKYCSQKCNPSWKIASDHAPDLRGPLNPRWKGGRQESFARFRSSEKYRAWRSEYLVKNREQYRANTIKRRAIIRGCSGTHSGQDIKNILNNQKSKCAICKCSIRDGYDVDHVIPLSKGGDNGPMNLQLLCPTCNRQKGAKDPIDFMQSKGFLL